MAVGSVVGGYRIDAPLSRGGMGVVYRATNLTLGQVYAIKIIAPELADDEQFRERFRREIRLAASLKHPNAVAVHYAGEQDGVLFLAMQLIEGPNLGDMLKTQGALAPERAVALLTQLTSALDAAHSLGLVHRDLKPANVLISREGGGEHAYLTDFGLAKRIDSASAYTGTGAVVGTLDYMAPEQVTGARLDARSDIYALGCVFFHMITGSPPFVRESEVAKMWAQVHDPPPSVRASRPVLHPAFDAVVAKAMAKDPAERYLSAGDFARDALAALDGTRYEGPEKVVATGPAAPADVTEVAPPPPPPSLPPQPATPAPATAAPAPAPARDTSGGGAARGTRGGASFYPPPSGPSVVPPGVAGPPPGHVHGGSRGGRWKVIVPVVLLAGAAVAAAIALSSGSSKKHGGARVAAFPSDPLQPVPTNRVNGAGMATLQLRGNVATVTIDTHGLLNGAAHAMHIHAFGKGQCPPASAARLHNGHLAISTSNGAPFYGTPVASLTTVGDTSPGSILAFSRYPATGSIRYTRRITLLPRIAAAVRRDNAVIIVHGIDYDGNGVYGNVLSRSELNTTVPAEATAPALCGPLHAAARKAAYAPTTTLYASLRESGPEGQAGPPLVCVLGDPRRAVPRPAA